MDDQGRISQSVARSQAPRRRPAAASRGMLSRSLRRFTLPLSHMRVPRYTGTVAGLAFLLAACAYGVVKGGHVPTIEAAIKDTSDAAALLTGASDTVAAATLQQRIDELAAAAGVRLASEEILPAQAAGDLRAITVRVTVSGPWKAFVNLLLALGQAEIPMIADEVQLRAPTATQKTPDVLLVDGSLTVTSYRAAGDAK